MSQAVAQDTTANRTRMSGRIDLNPYVEWQRTGNRKRAEQAQDERGVDENSAVRGDQAADRDDGDG